MPLKVRKKCENFTFLVVLSSQDFIASENELVNQCSKNYEKILRILFFGYLYTYFYVVLQMIHPLPKYVLIQRD